MNEQIEHCLYQSGLTAQGCWDELDDYARECIEKFAELLVRECAKISKETCNELKTDETIQMPALATSVNLYHATLRNKLDEHFGVEL
jgi:hypothetical protein